MTQVLKVEIAADGSVLRAEMQRAAASVRGATDEMRRGAQNAAEGFKQLGAVDVAKGVFGGMATWEAFKGVLRGALDGVLRMEATMRTMRFATGDADKGMAFSRKTAEELGLELQTTAGAYSKLEASAKGSALAGKPTQQIFTAVAGAMAVMGKSGADTEGALLAIGQMMSKGKVQAEELRKQLGERLPGAFQIAARAMGVSTAQLDKMLEQGQLVAETFLPKFAAELQRTLGDSPREASKSLQGAINRMKTAWLDFQVSLGQSGATEALAGALVGITSALRAIVDSGSLRVIADLLGNIVVQATALAVVANTMLVPSLLRLPVVSYTAAFGLQGLIYALKATAVAAWAAIGPWGLALAAIAGLGFGLARWASSYQRAAADQAEASARMRSEQTDNIRGFVEAHDKVGKLEQTLRSTASGTKAHADAQKNLNSVVRDLTKVYPDFIGYLKKEGNEYINVTASMEKYQKRKLKQLQADLDWTKEQERMARANATDAQAGGYQAKGWTPLGRDILNAVEWITVGKGISDEAEREAAAHKKSASEIEKQISMLKAWETDTPKASSALAKSKDIVTADEHRARLARLESEILQAQKGQNIEAETAARLADIRADHEEKVQRLQEERSKGKLSPGFYEAELAAVEEKRRQRILALIREMETKENDLAKKRIEIAERLQGDLTAAEEGGLAKRLEAIRKQFAKLREENQKYKIGISEKQILDAENAEQIRARIAQVREDLGKLRTEMAQLAEEKGRALSPTERDEALGRFASGSPERREAAAQYRQQEHIGDSGSQGFKAGIQNYVNTVQDAYHTMETLGQNIAQGVENGLAGGIENAVKRGQTAAQRWHALWMGISGSLVQALAKWGAQEVVLWGIQKARSMWGTQDTVKQVAQSGIKTAATNQETAANIGNAASGIAKAHAPIPFVGWAMAAAMIVAMLAMMSRVRTQAFAQGGIVDGPTLAMLGEAGQREFVAPEVTFERWGRNLATNIALEHRAEVGYQLQSGDLARTAMRQGLVGGGGGPVFPGAVIFTSNSREMEDFLERARRGYTGRTE